MYIVYVNVCVRVYVCVYAYVYACVSVCVLHISVSPCDCLIKCHI